MNYEYELEDINKVSVLCIKLGAIPHFETYLSVLKRTFSAMEISSLHFIDREITIIETFCAISKLREGRVAFKYLTSSASHYVTPLQFYKRCSVVIGMVEGSPDVMADYRTLWSYVTDLRGVLVCRLLCFNPVGVPVDVNKKSVVFITCPVLEDLSSHFQIVMSEVAIDTIISIVNEITRIKNSSEPIRLAHETDSRLSRKRQGREFKIYGEFASMLGCFEEAEKFLWRAMSLQKENKDFLFLGSTFDSFARLKLSLAGDRSEANLIPETLDEAIHYYQQADFYDLAAETKFKIARFCAKQGLKVEAVRQLDDFIKLYAKNLSNSDQLDFLSQTAKLCRTLGLLRKAAYCCKLAYKLSVKTLDYERAKSFLLDCLDSFQIAGSAVEDGRSDRRSINPATYFRRENLKPWLKGNPGWRTLQQETLNELIHVSRSLNSAVDSLKYRILKLELLRSSLTDEEQIRLSRDIESDAARLPEALQNIEVEMPFHPRLLKVEPQPSQRLSQTLGTENHLSFLKEDDIFIHNIWANSHELAWTQGNVETVKVYLENMFAYDINIVTSHICVEGAEICPGKA
jgi:hypothetical protein